MIKFTFIILFSILFSSCVNEVGDGSSTILAPGDVETGENEVETDENDEETDENDEETGENEVETDENDEETGENEDDTGKDKIPFDDDLQNDLGVGGDWNLGNGLVMGCMLEDALNYNPEANLPCTNNCVDNKTGSNCCCED